LESNVGSFLGLVLGETAIILGVKVLECNALPWCWVDGDLGSFGNFHVLERPGFGKNEPRMNGMEADKEVRIHKIGEGTG
jgi:hypothetical protein